MNKDGPFVKRLTLSGQNVGEFTVVRRSEASPTVERAAADLVKYIMLATGKRLPVLTDAEAKASGTVRRIFVGNTLFDTERVDSAVKKLKNDGYAVILEGGDLYLTGATDTGAMYAVYSFLEDAAGCRFYSSKFETVRKADAIEIPEGYEVSFSPLMINRDTHWFDTFDPAFAAKQKLNGAVRRNMDGYGTSMKYAGPFVHSLPALAGSKREPNVQPCLTDPAVYEKVLENARKYLRETPGAKIISISQNDSYPEGRGCQCENCRRLDDREGTPMGSLLTFVNRIAGELKKDWPDVYIDTLAYRYTRKAPKHLKPADNVIIRLCSIECCFSHPIESGCERNREFAEDLEAWAGISKNLFIWDYTTDFLYYVNPFPNLKVLYDNVRFFVKNHVIGLFEQGAYQSYSGEFGELRAYLLAKIMWDPDMSRERFYAYMDDFLQGYYGEGWRFIREYIDRTSELAAKGHMGIYYPIDRILNLDREEAVKEMREFRALWDKALALAEGEQRDNVEKSSLQVLYAYLCLYWDNDVSPKEKERLYELMKKYDIKYYREGCVLPENPDFTCPPDRW
jgi:hypothetical protein